MGSKYLGAPDPKILKWFQCNETVVKWKVFEHWFQKGPLFHCETILRGSTAPQMGSEFGGIVKFWHFLGLLDLLLPPICTQTLFLEDNRWDTAHKHPAKTKTQGFDLAADKNILDFDFIIIPPRPALRLPQKLTDYQNENI